MAATDGGFSEKLMEKKYLQHVYAFWLKTKLQGEGGEIGGESVYVAIYPSPSRLFMATYRISEKFL